VALDRRELRSQIRAQVLDRWVVLRRGVILGRRLQRVPERLLHADVARQHALSVQKRDVLLAAPHACNLH
jgi:hypothetical protein